MNILEIKKREFCKYWIKTTFKLHFQYMQDKVNVIKMYDFL